MKVALKCLGCYETIETEGYHPKCSKNLFGTETPPEIDFAMDQLENLAKESLSRHLAVTGVQPKISLEVTKSKDDPTHRLRIVGLWGNFILKPPSERFPDVAVVEDLTMHLAEIAGIETAKHGLIQLKSGGLVYVTRRFDRDKKGNKIAMEDFCQLSELLTESKYSTSAEKAGKIILRYAANSGLDAIKFFDLNLFSYLTGNADMHLKNFSLIQNPAGEYALSPAYDLLATKLMPINDPEESALTVNGKKAKIKHKDFLAFGEKISIPTKAMENSFARFSKCILPMQNFIDKGFLSESLKKRYKKLLEERAKIFTLISNAS